MQRQSVYTSGWKEGMRTTKASPFTMLAFSVTTVQTAQDLSVFTSLCFCVLPVIGSMMTWSSQGIVPILYGTFTRGNNTIVLPFCPLITLTGMQKGRAGHCLCRYVHTNTGIPEKFFSLCCIRLGGFLNPTYSSPNHWVYHSHLMIVDFYFIYVFLFYSYINVVRSLNLATVYGDTESGLLIL